MSAHKIARARRCLQHRAENPKRRLCTAEKKKLSSRLFLNESLPEREREVKPTRCGQGRDLREIVRVLILDRFESDVLETFHTSVGSIAGQPACT